MQESLSRSSMPTTFSSWPSSTKSSTRSTDFKKALGSRLEDAGVDAVIVSSMCFMYHLGMMEEQSFLLPWIHSVSRGGGQVSFVHQDLMPDIVVIRKGPQLKCILIVADIEHGNMKTAVDDDEIIFFGGPYFMVGGSTDPGLTYKEAVGKALNLIPRCRRDTCVVHVEGRSLTAAKYVDVKLACKVKRSFLAYLLN